MQETQFTELRKHAKRYFVPCVVCRPTRRRLSACLAWPSFT